MTVSDQMVQAPIKEIGRRCSCELIAVSDTGTCLSGLGSSGALAVKYFNLVDLSNFRVYLTVAFLMPTICVLCPVYPEIESPVLLPQISYLPLRLISIQNLSKFYPRIL